MAFNFNWSPLTADANFYQRATDLLTGALNKSPKPPIIVDDIIVTELNLGTQPPDLDILEIGDIAEDRFRGIFKMSYRGDAFLTLRTKVQANPLNTYLCSKPEFTSPSPLAAHSSLTIPLSITLSDFKLSGFVILVFSKQKGLTIVFRNDPLESLKVSSTFDSISFVRDYLQKTIEDQLRNLIMEELPAIIHRLSLRLWCPDQLPKEAEDGVAEGEEDEAAVDPLASPPLDPVDANGNLLDANDIASLSLNGSSERPSLFAQKNLLRLSALRDSHRTLSLFTPGIRTALWRANAGWDRSEGSTPPVLTPSITKTYSFNQGQTHSITSYTFSDTSSAANGQLPSRPSLASLNQGTSSLATGSGTRSRSYMGGKKQKRRVVRTPLRRSKSESAPASEASSETEETACNDTASVQGPTSEPCPTYIIPEEVEDDTGIPQLRFHSASTKADKPPSRPALNPDLFTAPQPELPGPNASPEKTLAAPIPTPQLSHKSEKSPASVGSGVYPNNNIFLEQQWISKMASEIARRVYDEKSRNEDFWADQPDVPPPAYEAQ